MGGPTVIATSVVRSAHKGQSHGGVYLVDLGTGRFEQVVDWDELEIDWSGRGLDRGLRGIAFWRGRTLIAASDAVLVYDRSFRLLETFENPYLRHCHEISLDGDLLWLTSTGFDSLLGFDLERRRFTRGLCLREGFAGRVSRRLFPSRPPPLRPFDPEDTGPEAGDTLHLNMVLARPDGLYCAGTRLGCLARVHDGGVSRYATIPLMTHNARPYRRGVLMNVTGNDVVRHADRAGATLEEWPVVRYDPERLEHRDLPRDHARQGFARGLCATPEGEIVVGSSPATVSLYRHGEPEPRASVNLTLDVRNAIHGLELYPW